MTSSKLRQRFLDFFKKRGHKIVPSSSLLSQDQTVLFTTAGMQQFSLYLSGEKDVLKDFGTRHLISHQKCLRSDDIEEVGDDIHNTFFEMLGNWSIGQDSKKGYFKEGAIKYALEFFVKELGLDKDRFWITVFKGEKNIPKDKESIKIWQENGIFKERIKEFGKEDNLWGPVGETGPCGPSSEIHYDRGEKFGCSSSKCGPNCLNCKRYIELWNLVFMEYYKDEKGNYQRLSQQNVDTGIGFERLIALLQGKPSAYETDLFWPIIQEIEKKTVKSYSSNLNSYRIIADHIRGSVFLISEEIFPSNIEKGYILRRLLRRAIRYGKLLRMPEGFLIPLAKKVIEIYKEVYPEILLKENDVLIVIQKEEDKFEKTLDEGLKKSKKVIDIKVPISVDKYTKIMQITDKKEIFKEIYHSEKNKKETDMFLRFNIKITSEEINNATISGKEAFDLYQTYGFPIEMIIELAQAKRLFVDIESFQKGMETHKEISRAGVEKKFGGIGKEAVYKAIKLHTATHLLHQALRDILGTHVKQMGSDINSKRLRFDFSHSQKMTENEIRKVEKLINQEIEKNLLVKKEEMNYQKALKLGALAFFKDKYPEKVTVYSINGFSKEICAGPHIKKTSDLGQFKIIKEQSSGAGVRRIRAVLK